MRTTILGITVPLLLLAATFAAVVPLASAQAATYEVSGQVVSDTGEPLEGVRVSGYTNPETADGVTRPAGTSSEAITDADGHFSLKLAAGKGYISVYSDAWRQGDGREITVDGARSNVTFILKTPPPKNAIISGVILGIDGKPVEGATVQLQYGCCYAMPMDAASASGSLPAGNGTEKADRSPSASAESPPSTSASTTPAPTEPATDPADGSAGSSSPDKRMASPLIMPPYYDDYQTVTTGADGTFSFKAYAGPRQITAWAKGYAQTTMQVTAVENDTVDVKVQLEKVPDKNAVFTGRVIDSKTGAPIPNANVNLRSLEWGRYVSVTTGKDGSFTLSTFPGWVEISVYVWNNEPQPIEEGAATSDGVASSELIARPMQAAEYYAFTQVLKLAAGDNKHDLKLDAKEQPTLVLLGYVVDPDSKKGVAGAQVNIWNQENGNWGQATADSTGSFKILVAPGHYSGSAYKDGYLGGTQTFVVTDEKVQRIDLVLPKGTPKYAPCYDDADCGGPGIYAKDMALRSDIAYAQGTSSDSTSVPSTAARGAPPAPMSDPAMSESSAAGSSGGREASYTGSGGGLPEYDPDAASTVPSAQATGTSNVPGLGIVALLGAAVAIALVARRR